MRSVFCRAEDPKAAIRALAKQLRNKYGVVATVVDEKNNIECGYYTIHFCKEREWEILSTTKPGSGYLTVPYNRLLLSANGVKPEECKLNHLIDLIVKSYKTGPVHPEEVPLTDDQKKSIEDYKKEAEAYAPAFSAVGADSASAKVSGKVQFNI